MAHTLGDLLVALGTVPAGTPMTAQQLKDLASEVTQAFKNGKVRCVFEDENNSNGS